MGRWRRNLLGMNATEAKDYFLRPDNYFRTKLPPYINFGPILRDADTLLAGKPLKYYCADNPAHYSDVNYKLLVSKDGKQAWRPLIMMHPAFYVDLVNLLTKAENWELLKQKIRERRKCKRILSASGFYGTEEVVGDTPMEIVNWWQRYEQESIRLALDYKYCLRTDITDCYTSISRSLLSAALGEELGEYLAESLAIMNGGQYLGLPQGPTMMDVVAEAALGYIDWKLMGELSRRQLKSGYLILRYRDDYRIFSNNPELSETIMRLLAKILGEYAMRLNPSKTSLFDDVLDAATKPDKVYWNGHRLPATEPSIQKHLLAIRELAKNYPNSGSLQTALVELYTTHIHPLDRRPQNADQLVSLVVDIARNNPRTYFVCAAILSVLLPLYNDRAGRKLLQKIKGIFAETANAEYFEICLQRVAVKTRRDNGFRAKLCKTVTNPTKPLWNSEWLGFGLDNSRVIDEEVIATMPTAVPVAEVNIFSPFESADLED